MVFRQTYEGIPVYGSDVRVHVSSAGSPRAITSKFLPGIQMRTAVASVSPRQAVEAARRHSEQPEKLQEIPSKAPELIIYYIANKYRLAWLLELPGVEKTSDGIRPARWRYFIDAEEGSVLSRYNDLKFQSSTVGHGKGVGGVEVGRQDRALPSLDGGEQEPQHRARQRDDGIVRGRREGVDFIHRRLDVRKLLGSWRA